MHTQIHCYFFLVNYYFLDQLIIRNINFYFTFTYSFSDTPYILCLDYRKLTCFPSKELHLTFIAKQVY